MAKRRDLERRGFPARHLTNLEASRGPGLDRAKALLPRLQGGDCLLVLCGDRGPGKTHMATWWAMELPDKARYFKAHDLLEAIRRSYSGDDKVQAAAQSTLTQARGAGYLVLDEFSELAGTDWERRTLTNLLDHRYDDMKITVIITNHRPEDAADAVGRSIWSRAQETGGVVVCDWPSYRTK